MHNLTASNIDTNMSAVAYDIPCLHLALADAIPNASQRAGGMGQTDTERSVDAHNKSGAISAVCQAGSAIYIGIPYKLSRIIRYGAST